VIGIGARVSEGQGLRFKNVLTGGGSEWEVKASGLSKTFKKLVTINFSTSNPCFLTLSSTTVASPCVSLHLSSPSLNCSLSPSPSPSLQPSSPCLITPVPTSLTMTTSITTACLKCSLYVVTKSTTNELRALFGNQVVAHEGRSSGRKKPEGEKLDLELW
jgi:hypothetical protein